jgi:hypothetical protein
MIPKINNKLVDQLNEGLRRNIKLRQDGVLTFSDNLFFYLYNSYKNGTLGKQESLFYLFLNVLFVGERYQDIPSRLSWSQELKKLIGEEYNSNICLSVIMGQGIPYCNTWKGRPLYKSATDQSILNMILYEHRPRSIIEIGTGNGSSAEYMGDIIYTYGYECNIVTFDIINDNQTIGNTQFVKADCNDLTSFNVIDYNTLKRPWLVLEDVHVNVTPVLNYFSDKMVEGDMMIVEDSNDKQQDIYSLSHKFKVDTRFTDYFGFNNTSSSNGVLKVLK